jgi:hypothetical protein
MFTLGDMRDVSLAALQSAGKEAGSSLSRLTPAERSETSMRIDAGVDLALDSDGLISPEARAQLVVLRDLAGQYGPNRLDVRIHLHGEVVPGLEANALRDLEDVYPGALHFDHDGSTADAAGAITLRSAGGKVLQEWHGFQNAATLGGVVRARLGAPQYSHMQKPVSWEKKQ